MLSAFALYSLLILNFAFVVQAFLQCQECRESQLKCWIAVAPVTPSAMDPEKQRKIDELKACLNNARVQADLVKALMEDIMLESLEDLVNYVNETKYEEEIQDLVFSVATFKDNKLAVARVRAAWRQAHTALKSLEARTQKGDAMDDLKPLPQQTSEDLAKAWASKYSIVLDIRLTPSDTLVGRCWREFKRVTPSLISIRKVRSLFAAQLPKKERTVSLGQSTKLQLDVETDRALTSVVEYYFGLRILINAFVWAGNFLADSKTKAGEKVIFSPMAVNMTYCDECLRKATELHCDSGLQLSWLEERDLLTRGKMVALMKQGFPQGEALEQALLDTAVQWSVVPTAHTKRPFPTNDQHQLPQKQKTVTKLASGDEICKKHNDNRGCRKDPAKCPDGRKHVCDAARPDGRPCGNPKHTRKQCPHFNTH